MSVVRCKLASGGWGYPQRGGGGCHHGGGGVQGCGFIQGVSLEPEGGSIRVHSGINQG